MDLLRRPRRPTHQVECRRLLGELSAVSRNDLVAHSVIADGKRDVPFVRSTDFRFAANFARFFLKAKLSPFLPSDMIEGGLCPLGQSNTQKSIGSILHHWTHTRVPWAFAPTP
jgi:hypothetical protein